MMDLSIGNREADRSLGFSRRKFLARTSCFGAFYAAAKLIPLPALAAKLTSHSRVSQTLLADKGFASVRTDNFQRRLPGRKGRRVLN